MDELVQTYLYVPARDLGFLSASDRDLFNKAGKALLDEGVFRQGRFGESRILEPTALDGAATRSRNRVGWRTAI